MNILDKAIEVSKDEQEFAKSSYLLERLFPHFLDDPDGKTVTAELNKDLNKWLADMQDNAAISGQFKVQFTLLSKHVTEHLRGCRKVT